MVSRILDSLPMEILDLQRVGKPSYQNINLNVRKIRHQFCIIIKKMKKSDKNLDLLEDENLGQKLVKKGFWLYLFSYLIAPAGYIVRLLISNSPEVSVADVGVLYTIIGLVNFLNVYNDLWLTESLQYFLPKFWIRKEYNHIKTTIWLSLGAQMFTSLLIVWGLLVGNQWLANNYFHSQQAATILQYFCIYFLGINLFQTLQSIFIAFQKTFDHQIIDLIKMRSIVCFTAFCFFSGRQSIERYSLNWLIGLGIWLTLGSIIYFRKYRTPLMQGKFEWDKPMLRDYSRYALWAFIWANVGNLFGQIIQQMVIYFLGAEAAGYYANFLSLFLIGNILLGPIMWLIFPIVSELTEKKDHNKLWFLCSFFYNYFSILVFSVSILFISLGPEIAITFLGEKYLASGWLLSRASFFLLFNIFSGFNFSILAGLGKIKERVKILGIWTIVTILLAYWGINFFGLKGAGIAFGISYFTLRILSVPYLLKVTMFSLQGRFIIKNLIILFLLLGILYFWKDLVFMKNENRLIMMTKLICIWLLYGIIITCFNWGKIIFLKNEIKQNSKNKI